MTTSVMKLSLFSTRHLAGAAALVLLLALVAGATVVRAGEGEGPVVRRLPMAVEAPAAVPRELAAPIHAGSKAFGSVVHPIVGYPLSFVHWRHGRLEGRAGLANALAAHLRPLDILVFKNGFRLSDKIIPGYFTHTAIWVGDEHQLRRAGLWDDPAIRPVRSQIRRGLTLIDVGRNGVRLERLSYLLNTDRIVVVRVRPKGGARPWRSRVLATALSTLGRPYDYNFDVETERALTCAELTYRSFSGVGWPSRPLLGRRTVFPDDIVATALARRGGAGVVLHIEVDEKRGWRLQSPAALRALLREGAPRAAR